MTQYQWHNPSKRFDTIDAEAPREGYFATPQEAVESARAALTKGLEVKRQAADAATQALEAFEGAATAFLEWRRQEEAAVAVAAETVGKRPGRARTTQPGGGAP